MHAFTHEFRETVWYNFVKMHKSLRMTPAMAVNVTDRLWSMEDIAALIDAAAPKPGQRGPYTKRTAPHHWMYDSGLYPIEAIKLLQAHWQTIKGVPDHRGRMKDAGAKAALTRKRRAAGRKASETRRENAKR